MREKKKTFCEGNFSHLYFLGKTVWHYWAQNGDIDTIRFSLRRCQVLYDSHELVSLLNSKDNRGLTPLHHAALYCVDDFSAISEVVQLFVTDASASVFFFYLISFTPPPPPFSF